MRRFLLLAAALCSSCVIKTLDVQPVDVAGGAPISIQSPVKAHLLDGSTVVFEKGVTVAEGEVRGDGRKYDLTLDTSVRVSSVPVDDVAAMESYQTPVHATGTAAASTATTAGIVVGSVVLIKAIFGSCPTIYTIDGQRAELQAESFSYSIAPAYEARDVDRLSLIPIGGRITLELRNEALETHYINQLELLELSHSPGETVFPDEDGQPIAVSSPRAPISATDSSGRDVGRMLARADGEVWSTPDERLRRVSREDFEDHIDLVFEVAESATEAALILRLRNSLLNTVLLYDVMLKNQGFKALDWMGRDINRFPDKLKLGYWYKTRMGMRIAVWDRGRYRDVGRVGDTGPIAWDEVAVRIPVPEPGLLRVRLSFVADNWRVDRVAAATGVRELEPRVVALSNVMNPDDTALDSAVPYLKKADDAYLITKPGDRLMLHFDVGAAADNSEHTYFLAATGYYMEWMRRDWLVNTTAPAFEPSDDALLAALSLWESRREEFRAQFESTRIPVR
jgi:hypothetical protein